MFQIMLCNHSLYRFQKNFKRQNFNLKQYGKDFFFRNIGEPLKMIIMYNSNINHIFYLCIKCNVNVSFVNLTGVINSCKRHLGTQLNLKIPDTFEFQMFCRISRETFEAFLMKFQKSKNNFDLTRFSEGLITTADRRPIRNSTIKYNNIFTHRVKYTHTIICTCTTLLYESYAAFVLFVYKQHIYSIVQSKTVDFFVS